MRATTVRFSEELWNLLEREAQREGVSAAQFIRDATILRTAYAMGQRGDAGFEEALARAAAPDGPRASRTGARRRKALLDAAAAVRGRGAARRGARNRAPRLRHLAVVRSPRASRRARAQRARGTGLARGRRPAVLQELSRHAGAMGLQARLPLSTLLLPARSGQPRAAARDDAREHQVLRDNLAIRDMGVIAYAGIPLIDTDGHALGTLCVIDSRPRHWTTHQVQLLSDIAASVVTEIAFAKTATQATSE